MCVLVLGWRGGGGETWRSECGEDFQISRVGLETDPFYLATVCLISEYKTYILYPIRHTLSDFRSSILNHGIGIVSGWNPDREIGGGDFWGGMFCMRRDESLVGFEGNVVFCFLDFFSL